LSVLERQLTPISANEIWQKWILELLWSNRTTAGFMMSLRDLHGRVDWEIEEVSIAKMFLLKQ
jgi:hypothetical protein